MEELHWFDQALAQRDYEITGAPKHWEATDEKKAADAKLKAVVQAEILKARENEAKRNLQPHFYHMPIKSVRSLNTAFKLYAVKVFNGKMKERLTQRLAELQAQASKKESDQEVSGE